jgi:hypothetical protein
MGSATLSSRRGKIAFIAVVCAIAALPLLALSHRGAAPFAIGACLIGIAVGLAVVSAVFGLLARLP